MLLFFQSQLKWPNFPGVHSLLLKGCTNPATYESTIRILSHMTLLLDFSVVDPSQLLAFPMNVIALLPYMVQVSGVLLKHISDSVLSLFNTQLLMK